MRYKTVEWNDFFTKTDLRNVCIIIDSHKVSAHLRKHGSKYVITGLTLVLFNGLSTDVLATSGSGIDIGAKKIYEKIINIGKWVIIIKGGMDCIQGVANGDLQETKKKFIGYLLVYALLFALPWGMEEIERLFDEMNDSAVSGDI